MDTHLVLGFQQAIAAFNRAETPEGAYSRKVELSTVRRFDVLVAYLFWVPTVDGLSRDCYLFWTLTCG